MDFQEEIYKSKASYDDEWDYTSKLYHQEGTYDLVAQDFNSGLTTLEIGCGSGYSTISLSSKSKRMITIDENHYCIESTYKKLNSLKANVSKLIRGKVIVNDNDMSYKMEYDKLVKESKEGKYIQCIEGDILTDPSLTSFLEGHHKFDLITCWMIGAHGLILNHELQISKGRTAMQRHPHMVQDYKFDILERVADLSKNLLDNDGTLSIIERVNLDYIRQFENEDILKVYNDRILPRGYELTNGFELHEINTRSKMAMVTHGGITNLSKIGLLSLKYKKNDP